ncbi:uncharacterized protein LOC121726855 isoform X2 [Aricia agestis]|uniref:uncharacterized protein LOC121726855 isoform X2 n=1 Tax=Aricia agestis TaxID=91739 RepID=UPI001C208037|nr:uncharacterized protein LOC121726855 isoform X2 [Aricia agestis]
MDFKLALVFLVLVALAGQFVYADMYYDRFSERAKVVAGSSYKCSPGTTTVKIVAITRARDSESESDSQEALRTHMNSGIEEKRCLICVCSVDGTEEHCRGRPARNANECLRMDSLRAEMERGLPYDHDRILAYRIRRVGNVNSSTQCTPFVSEYNDCSEELKERKKNRVLTPAPKPKSDVVVGRATFEDYFSLPPRLKRSVESDSLTSDDPENRTIKFYNTGNEIHEDTLKRSTNDSGTVKAHKFGIEAVPKNARRTSSNQNYSKTIHNMLHIEPTQNTEFDQGGENKIESSNNEKVLQNKNIVGNYSQSKKNAEISKMVANELKDGIEIIGEKGLNPVSNITFTPENDTVVAMAYVAGNLLNKLWEMEKYTGYSTMGADTLKHEKINELLDLFKEPLSIKQETLLKNALEKLAKSIVKNKNINNFTFCETFHINDDNEMPSSDSESSDEIDFQFKTKNSDNKPSLTKRIDSNRKIKTLSKMKNILDSINDLEKVQRNIEDVGRSPAMLSSTKHEHSGSPAPDTIKSFRNVVNKISKLLMPTTNVRGDKKGDIKNDDNMTFKDQLILQYIKLIESNSSCFQFNNNLETEAQTSILKIEGNILNNISEFLKIKSFEDLVKILKKETKIDPIKQIITTTPKSELRSEQEKSIKSIPRGENTTKMKTVKENLKKHLKAVIDDLIQIQSENNSSEVKKINIAQALPCIYGLLNEKKPNFTKPKNTEASIQNIKTLFNDLKADLKTGGPTRRQHSPEASSQSIKVFERILKSMDKLLKQKSRRNSMQTKPKTVGQIESMIDKAKLTHSLFDNMKVLSNITEKNQLMLLKAIEAETNKKESILTNLQKSMEVIAQLPADKQRKIEDFIETTNKNIDLGHRLLENIKKKINVKELTTSAPENTDSEGATGRKSDEASEYRKSNYRFTRDQIVSQLIKNRVTAYMKKREAMGMDLSNNIKYLVAGKILSKLRDGNHELAKELFEIFINTGDGDAIYFENDRDRKPDPSVIKPSNILGDVLDESDLEAMDATRSQPPVDYLKNLPYVFK